MAEEVGDVTYIPTHDVPDGGLPAWVAPDGSQVPVTSLAAGLDVQVVEQRGQWARIAASNGWEGWVDAGRLVPRAAAPEPEAAAPEPAAPEPEPGAPEPEAAAPAPEPAASEPGGFVATHAVPAEGLQTWAAPDPTQPALATLAAGTELRVTEERGQWAAVEASNGWTGWVDSTRLQSVAPVATPGVPPPPTTYLAPPDGLQGWQEPDPSQPAIATLHGGAELVMVEQRGQWAQVEMSNGWKVWVDATRLVPKG